MRLCTHICACVLLCVYVSLGPSLLKPRSVEAYMGKRFPALL